MRGRARILTAGLGVLLVALILAGAYVVARGYPAEFRARLGESGTAARVTNLDSIDQLQTTFNQDAGSPRLVLLFSPT